MKVFKVSFRTFFRANLQLTWLRLPTNPLLFYTFPHQKIQIRFNLLAY